MKSKVKVTAQKGIVVMTSENNPEWGYIRVEQSRIVVDENGFSSRKTISALIYGKIAELKTYGWTEGMELEGTIVAVDRTTPFNTLNPEKDLKIAGKTAIVCSVEGKPIYRKTFYRNDPAAVDLTIAHDNGAEIKAAFIKLQEEEAEAATAAQAATAGELGQQ